MIKTNGALCRVCGEGRDQSGNRVVVCQVRPKREMFCQQCGKRMGQGELFSRGRKQGDDGEQFSFCRMCRLFSQMEPLRG